MVDLSRSEKSNFLIYCNEDVIKILTDYETYLETERERIKFKISPDAMEDEL